MKGRTLDRFEQESADFHRAVRDGFHRMANDEPERWVVIDANEGVDQVARAIRQAVHDRLGL
jgi:dTMP kinase